MNLIISQMNTPLYMIPFIIGFNPAEEKSKAQSRRRASAVPNSLGIKFDKSTAEARRLNQTFELSSALN